MSRLAGVATALPTHVLPQEKAREIAMKVYADHPDLLRLLRIFTAAGVQQRHFAFPPEYYSEERTFDERNADFIEQGTLLAGRAVKYCLGRSGTKPEQVDHIFLVTTTGLATPSLDALLVPKLGFRRNVLRSPLFGLGCAGGVAALARAADYVRGHPTQRALVVSVELCGQVFSTQAMTPVDVVGAALFGDGAAAALVAGAEVPGTGPQIVASRSALFNDTQDLMGWTFTSDGMRLVLSPDIPEMIPGALKDAVERFIADCELTPSRIGYWALHPGGRRVIEAYKKAFGLGEAALEWTRGSLARVGNVSSASALFILGDLLAKGRPGGGEKALVCALGPGFAAEMVLLSG